MFIWIINTHTSGFLAKLLNMLFINHVTTVEINSKIHTNLAIYDASAWKFRHFYFCDTITDIREKCPNIVCERPTFLRIFNFIISERRTGFPWLPQDIVIFCARQKKEKF